MSLSSRNGNNSLTKQDPEIKQQKWKLALTPAELEIDHRERINELVKKLSILVDQRTKNHKSRQLPNCGMNSKSA